MPAAVPRGVARGSNGDTGRIQENRGYQMEPYICTVCQYVYDPYLGDPDNGVPPGTPFADLPADWVCPVCGVGKEAFEPE